MSKYYGNSVYSDHRGKGGKRKNPWITFLKVLCGCIVALIVICAIAFTILTVNLTPAKITKLIKEKSAEYLVGDIEIGSLDYKFFKTFPWLDIEIDSLRVISKSLDNITQSEKDSLPADADLLASVMKIKCDVNVKALLHDEIVLRNIMIEKPVVNIVMVNDSVGNFNILPEIPKLRKMPELDISEIKIIGPVNISFVSLKDEINSRLEIETFSFSRNNENYYTISFNGQAEGSYREYSLPGTMPLQFMTEIKPSFRDVSINLNHLAIVLGSISLDASGNLDINKDGVDIENFDLQINVTDLFTFVKELPKTISSQMMLPDYFTGNLPLTLSVTLSSPLHLNRESIKELTLGSLPTMTASLKVTDATLSLTPPKNKRIFADDIYVDLRCDLNPLRPYSSSLTLRELRLNGEGVSLSGTASIDNLTGDKQHITGNFNFSSSLLESLSYILPKNNTEISGVLKGNINLNGNTENLCYRRFENLVISGDLFSNSLKLTGGSAMNVSLNNMKTDFKVNIPEYPLSDYTGTALDIEFSADTIRASSQRNNLFLTNLDLDLKTSCNKSPLTKAALAMHSMHAKEGSDDALIASRVSHTPLFLEYNGKGMLQTIMNEAKADLTLNISNGIFDSPIYLYPFEFTRLNLSTNLDKLKLTADQIRVSRTNFSIDCGANALKSFLTSYGDAPLKVSANINFSNVDINKLAWGYYGALLRQGKDSVFYLPPMTPFNASDSVCVAIPRNIEADIRLNANSAEYMQFNFSPLSAGILVKKGKASLSQLTVGTPYCTAVVDWTYSTENLADIFMDLNARIKDFNFKNFYGVFPQLTAKSPELKDFSGILNADINCYFQMFPAMFMNGESLKGDIELKGTQLEFARQGKIEHITHLMLIEGDAPIKIDNISIRGAYHDNLFQLNPFKIGFDDYLLELAGINNLRGDMYYHIALEKSPLHLPFGVSLTGTFAHPKFRLGGTHLNDYRTEMESPVIPSNINVNVMAYLRHGWLMFLQEAAKYEEKKNN